MQDTVTVLREARALIEQGWAKGTYARDAAGHRTGVTGPESCRFCAVGAVCRVLQLIPRPWTLPGDPPALDEAMRLLQSALPEGFTSIYAFNDAQRHKKAVLALYDRAITLAEQEATP